MQYHKQINKIVSFKTKKAMSKNIEKLIEQISNDINNDTFKWINQYRIIKKI